MSVKALPTSHQTLVKMAGIASVCVASLLIVIKFSVWLMTGSVSLLASLVDSTMDSLVSLVNFFAIRYALMPADEDHRFGHGKAEALAGLVQAAFITGSAGFLLLHAIEKILNPKPIAHTDSAIAVMVVSIILTLLLVVFQRHAARKTGSTAIKADSLHYVSDLLVNLSIIGALLLAQHGYHAVDAWVGIAIAGYIVVTAAQIGYEAVQLLLDRELGPDVWNTIDAIVKENPDVTGYHELRTRQSGHTQFIQLHIDLDKHMPLLQAHAIAEEIEQAIRHRYPNADVLIHTDPV